MCVCGGGGGGGGGVGCVVGVQMLTEPMVDPFVRVTFRIYSNMTFK